MKVREGVCLVLLAALVFVAAEEEEVFQNVVEELSVETVVSSSVKFIENLGVHRQ